MCFVCFELYFVDPSLCNLEIMVYGLTEGVNPIIMSYQVIDLQMNSWLNRTYPDVSPRCVGG